MRIYENHITTVYTNINYNYNYNYISIDYILH